MQKAWPTIPKAQQKNLKTAFDMFYAIHLTLNCKDDDIHIQGDTATAACWQSAVYTMKGKKAAGTYEHRNLQPAQDRQWLGGRLRTVK